MGTYKNLIKHSIEAILEEPFLYFRFAYKVEMGSIDRGGKNTLPVSYLFINEILSNNSPKALQKYHSKNMYDTFL
jgi:hypothetical protein